ncbi:MAG: FitA-like ribbon-helix-helix domain-containing protein [Thermodesulfobacteriota bacterium]
MSKMIQIRNVPDEVHKALKIRAAKEGLSLSDFLTREVENIVKRPSVEEVLGRIKNRKKLSSRLDSVKAVRQERESRK